MRYCRSKNYNFQLLLNDPLFQNEPQSETYMNNQDEPTVESILDFNAREMDSLKNNINFGRVALDLSDDQKYMMSFAWVNPKELYLLEAFPEVIMIDTTEKTNNEKRPLLTAAGKDSNGNMFIFLRVFMPNQQSWMFRWVFSVVFPRLIPKNILQHVKIVITDGDAQEFTQVDNAIVNVIPNAQRVRCGWHIVHQGFDRYVDTTFPDIPSSTIDEHKKIIMTWMYSWMKRRCITYLQYKYSRYLFVKYIYSPEIVNLFGLAFANNVSLFLRKYVVPYEKNFIYCNRKDVRHYGEYSNTPLEGTNNGLKHASIGTHPGLSMDNSMVILSLQSDKHVKKINGNVIRQNTKECLNYTDKIHNKLTSLASSMISNMMSLVSRYDTVRTGEKEWRVKKKKASSGNYRKTCIPDFDVLSIVYMVDTSKNTVKQLMCSCGYNKVYGLPCVHSLVVANSFSPKWSYINHNDVSVRWLKTYYLYSLPDKVIPNEDMQQKVKQVFRLLRKKEQVGIHINEAIFMDVQIHNNPIPEDFLQQEHVVRCTNYPDSDQVPDFDPFNSNFDGTLSQITNIGTQMCSDEEDEDVVLQFVSDNINASIESNQNSKSYYSQLKPNFNEAVNWITCQEEVDQFKKVMDEFVCTIKTKHNNLHSVSTGNHTYISSNLPIEKSKKHHGCTGWAQTKKKRKK